MKWKDEQFFKPNKPNSKAKSKYVAEKMNEIWVLLWKKIGSFLKSMNQIFWMKIFLETVKWIK